MKVALVHDALINRGGAERVFQVLCEMFDRAPVYTSVYLRQATLPFFESRDIRTTPLQRVVRNEGHLKALFPLALYYMSRIRLDEFDLIISSSTFCAKFVGAGSVPHICLCYRPFRLLWSSQEYDFGTLAPPLRLALRLSLPTLRKVDYRAAQRVHTFVTTTPEMKRLIRDVYGRDALVLRPPVSLKSPPLSQGEGEFYLVVSRLEAYKRVDLAVEAFNVLGAPLLVAGSGSLAARLKRLAKTNITFLGAVPDAELSNLYRDCRAVVCPQQEDFGLVALEANACGKPAICYGFGGATETMIPHTGSNGDAATAVFFYEQSISALVRAVRSLEEAEFRDETLQLNALRFHPRHFREEFMALANTVLYGPGSTETAEFSATAAR